MGLTWEKIKRSLGIPDKLIDAEAADEQTSPEYTGRNQPQIEPGPFGALAVQDGPRATSGLPEAVLANASYVQDRAHDGPAEMRNGRRGDVEGPGWAGTGRGGDVEGPGRAGAGRGGETDMEIGDIGGNGGQEEEHGMGKGSRHDGPQTGHDDGVRVNPTPITLGETVQVTYRGPLAQGTGPVHLHWGFGPGQWTHVQDVPMHRKDEGYTATLNVDKDGRFEFCFHDNQGNWDNNDGHNWSYIIHDGEL